MSYDHPDPSIFTVLTSPTATPGTANVDFGVIPDRWSVAENTFRPPPFHRNVCSEFVGLVKGRYIGKAEGFEPGCASLHNCMSGHGPDNDAFEAGSKAANAPQYFADTLTIIFETQLVIKPTRFALETRAARARLLAPLARAREALPPRVSGGAFGSLAVVRQGCRGRDRGARCASFRSARPRRQSQPCRTTSQTKSSAGRRS